MNIFLFHGTDSFSVHQKTSQWKKAFLLKQDQSSLETLQGKNLSLPSFKMKALSVPFLSEKKLLIIKDFFATNKAEAQKEMAEILPQIPETTIILFQENKPADKRTSLYKTLKKDYKIEEFTLPEKFQLHQWISKQASKKHLIIDSQTAQFLADHSNKDLWQLNNQLDQLKHYVQNNQITKQDITDLFTLSPENNVFLLTDYLGEKNTKAALKTLSQLLQSGEEIFKIFHLIIRQFRLLIRSKILQEQGFNSSEINKQLKLHPFVAKKISQQIKNFTLPQLIHIFQQLQEIDHQFKTGKIRSYQQDHTQFLLALEKLLIRC